MTSVLVFVLGGHSPSHIAHSCTSLHTESLTASSNSSRVIKSMIGKKLFLVLAAGTLLFLQAADCMSAMTPDQESMQCCGSMPCTPANHIQGCCKTMTSPQTLNMVATTRVALHAPTVATLGYPRTLGTARSASGPLVTLEARQQSPPELCTLHAPLLI